jgi:hypothetical protein
VGLMFVEMIRDWFRERREKKAAKTTDSEASA